MNTEALLARWLEFVKENLLTEIVWQVRGDETDFQEAVELAALIEDTQKALVGK